MAISYHVVGQTEGTGTITANVSKGGLSLHTAIDVDQMGADAVTGDVARMDALTAVPLTPDSRRNFSRGDVMGLYVSSGVADSVPLGALTAHVLVWVKGHVDYTSAYANGVDHPSAVTGPALGGLVAIPFINKRLAQAALRTEDRVLLPSDLRVVAVVQARQVTQTTSRLIGSSDGDVTGGAATQNYILHNQGSNFPAPGSWVGNTVTYGLTAGEDNARRYQQYNNSLLFRLTGAGSPVLNDTAHVLCATRSHVYGAGVEGTAIPTPAEID
jgi:hypothetical protein